MDESQLDPNIMDAGLLAEALKHFTAKPVAAKKPHLVALHDLVRDNCPEPAIPPKYRGLVEPLAVIAPRIGLEFPASTVPEIQARFDQIKSDHNSIGKGHRSKLLGPFIAWAWIHHRHLLIPIFEGVGFTEYAEAEERARVRSAARAKPVLAFIQERSPHDLDALFVRARERLVLVAQNHWYMINQAKGSKTDFWPKIANALSRGVSVEIVAMHRDTAQPIADIAQADPILTWAQFMKVEEFGEHIDLCWETLMRFKASYEAEEDEIVGRAKALGISAGQLKLKKAWFLPYTLSFVDPDSPESMAVISPRTSSPISGTRADFVITKTDHPEIYSHFWNYVNHGKAHQKWAMVWSSEQADQ